MKTPKTTKPAVKRVPAKTAQKYPNKELQALIPAEIVHELPKDIPTKPLELTMQDIQHFRQILEVVSARGAFKPDEMILVGETYSKLTAFLAANQNG